MRVRLQIRWAHYSVCACLAFLQLACAPNATDSAWPPADRNAQRYVRPGAEWREGYEFAAGQHRFQLGPAPANARLRVGIQHGDAADPATLTVRVDETTAHASAIQPKGRWQDLQFDLSAAGSGEVVVEIDGPAHFWVSDLELFAPSTEHTNVLVILLDTVGRDKLGVYGYARDTTPHIDALARDAVVFERLFAAAPWTAPVIASLFTATYPQTHGTTEHRVRFPPFLPTLAETLANAGYHAMANVANRGITPAIGFGRGFDSYAVRSKFLGDGRLVDLAVEGIQSAAGRPWFAYVHVMGAHSPYDPPQDLWDRYQPKGQTLSRAALTKLMGEIRLTGFGKQVHLVATEGTMDYNPNASEDAPLVESRIDPDRLKAIVEALHDAELRNTDRQLQRLFDTLDAQGEMDNTVVVILGDHGEGFWQHGFVHHSNSMYDELLGVPLIIRPAGGNHARRVPNVVEHVDVAPTILDLAGVPYDWPHEGRSLVPLMNGADAAPHIARSLMANKSDARSFPFEPPLSITHYRRALSDGRYKAIRDDASGSLQFFDLAADPGEQHPLDAVPEVFEQFNQAFAQTGTDCLSGLTILLCAEPGKDTVFTGTISGAVPDRMQFRAQLSGRTLEREGDAWRFEVVIDGSRAVPYAAPYYNPILFGDMPPDKEVVVSIMMNGKPIPEKRRQLIGAGKTTLPGSGAFIPGNHRAAFSSTHPAHVKSRPQVRLWYAVPGDAPDTGEMDPETLKELGALGYL